MTHQEISEGSARENIVEKAMLLFWGQGAEIASYNDIVEATGVSRKALYAQWPDKDALVKDTLQKYSSQMLSIVADQMSAGGRQGLEEFWNIFESDAKRDSWVGCYLHRTASGPLRWHDYVAKLYQNYLVSFGALISGHIVEGQKKGDIAKDIDAKSAGLMCFSLVSTMSTIGAQTGYGAHVAEIFVLLRKTCGLREPHILPSGAT